MQTRAAQVAVTSWNPADRSVEIAIATDRPVRMRRWGDMGREDYDEVLVMTEESCGRARLDSGAMPLLLEHVPSATRQIGRFLPGTARFEVGADGLTSLLARCQLSDVEEDRPAVERILSGITRSVSVGYRVTATEEDRSQATPLVRATRWELYEGSIVAVPADVGASVRSAASEPRGGNPMSDQPTATQPTAEEIRAQVAREITNRNTEIEATARKLRLDLTDAAVRALVNDPAVTLDAARARLVDLAAERADATPTTATQPTRITQGADEGDHFVRHAESALLAQGEGKRPPAEAARFSHFRSMDYAREALRLQGVSVDGRTQAEIASMALRGGAGAMGTGLFPSLVSNVANKRLARGYERDPGTYRRVAQFVPASDFKVNTLVFVDSFTDTAIVEGGDNYQFATITEGAETWRSYRRGRIAKMTPELLINDDLGAFMSAMEKMGATVERSRNVAFWSYFLTAPNLADAAPIWGVARGNQVAAGGAPSDAQLGEMRRLMRIQTDRDGNAINLAARIPILPAALETAWAQLLAPIYASQPTNSSTVAATLMGPVVEPLLDASSVLRYWMVADPAMAPAFVWSTVSGFEGPMVTSETDFDSSCLKIKVEDSFGRGAVDFRPIVYNPGT